MKFLLNLNKLPFLFVFSLLGASGCAMHYVADYDAAMEEEIFQVAKSVDAFWGALIDTGASKRQYDKFKDKYNQIETDMRMLVMKNEIRTLNKESTKQAAIALDLWVEDRRMHKKNDMYSDFEASRHRQQYTRVFTAMAKGEAVKNISEAKSSAD